MCCGHLSVLFRLEVTLNLSLDFCFLKPVVSIGGALMPRPPLASWVQPSGVRPQHGNFEKLPGDSDALRTTAPAQSFGPVGWFQLPPARPTFLLGQVALPWEVRSAVVPCG